MIQINRTFEFASRQKSLATIEVMDLFGAEEHEQPYVVADRLELDVRPGDVVLFHGASGCGKSTILREVAQQVGAVDAMAIPLPDRPLVDALPGTVPERLATLSACGLGEARLLLRSPNELSDGQRYRFRLALALAMAESGFLMADEFCAFLDRTLAKVVSFNLRKRATRSGVGCLLATTHDDLQADLRPDLDVHCLGDGRFEIERNDSARQPARISFAGDLTIREGTREDWEPFARWHYRSHTIGFVKRIVVLEHDGTPVGICIFACPAASLRRRSEYFGLKGSRTRLAMQALNEQLWLLSRVVIHPTYRGAGIAADFVRQACDSCPIPWIETLSAMGQANPFFEKAGFVRVGIIEKDGKSLRGGHYGGRTMLSEETRRKSTWSEPVYYVYDNRKIVRPDSH